MKSDYALTLLRAAKERDMARFWATARQAAAAEKHAGRREIGEAMDRIIGFGELPVSTPVRVPHDLANILEQKEPVSVTEVALTGEQTRVVARIMREYKHEAVLREHGVRPTRRFIFQGPPGSGKSLLARAIAKEAALPLFLVNLYAVVDSHLGGTGARLAKVFHYAKAERAVFVLDEMDAIASHRGSGHDVGEMTRIVATILQLMDNDDSESVFVATTNRMEELDRAIVRRFEKIVTFEAATVEQAYAVMAMRAGPYFHGDPSLEPFEREAGRRHGILEQRTGAVTRLVPSLADIARATEAAVRTMALEGKTAIGAQDVIAEL